MKHHALFLLLLATPLAGCSTPSQTPMPEPAPICAFTPEDTSAWINMMPGPGGPPGDLVVMVKHKDDGLSRRFDSRGVGEDGTLRLDVVEWGPDAGRGKIVYRGESLKPDRIEIYCSGNLVTTIEEVTIAQ